MKDKIVTFGEVLLRFSKFDYRRLCQGSMFSGNYGGSEANVAVSLATLGDNVEYVSRVPDNEIGHACCMKLREYNVNINHIRFGGDRLGTYYFEEAAAMRNSCVVYDRKDSSFYSIKPGMIDWQDVFKDAKVFHCSGITCAISQDAADATMEAVRIAKKMGLIISCDINYRKNLWNYGADAHDVLCQLLKYSDIIFGDTGEYELVSARKRVPFTALSSDYEIDKPEFKKWFEQVKSQFPNCKKFYMALRNQITTNHHTLSGLLYFNDTMKSTRIYNIEGVVDPMGVGDAFIAAYLHAYLHRPDDDQYCLEYSLAASTLKNSIPGDFNLSTDEEIKALMNKNI